MPLTLADLIVLIGANSDKYDQDLSNTERETKNWANRVGGSISTALGGAVMAGAALAGTALIGVGVMRVCLAVALHSRQ